MYKQYVWIKNAIPDARLIPKRSITPRNSICMITAIFHMRSQFRVSAFLI